MKNKKVLGMILVVLLISYSIFIFTGYNSINKKYPNPTRETRKMNEMIQLNSLEIEATDFVLLDSQQLVEKYGEDVDLSSYQQYSSFDNLIFILVEIKVTNPTDVVQNTMLYNSTITTIDNSNGLDLMLFSQINKDDTLLVPTLKSGETITMVMPYSFFKDSLNSNGKNSFNEQSFELVISMYPVRYSFEMPDVQIPQ